MSLICKPRQKKDSRGYNNLGSLSLIRAVDKVDHDYRYLFLLKEAKKANKAMKQLKWMMVMGQ